MCQVSIKLVESKLYLKVSALMVKKQLKTAADSYLAAVKKITKVFLPRVLYWAVCQLSIQLVQLKLDFKFSILLVEQQLKTATDSYPADGKNVYPGILVRDLRLSCLWSFNSIGSF